MRCESPFMFGIEGKVSKNGKQEPRFSRCIEEDGGEHGRQ